MCAMCMVSREAIDVQAGGVSALLGSPRWGSSGASSRADKQACPPDIGAAKVGLQVLKALEKQRVPGRAGHGSARGGDRQL